MRRVRLSIASVTLAFIFAIALGATSAAGTTYVSGGALSVLSDGVLVSHAGGAFVAAIDGESLHPGDAIRSEEGRAIVTYFEGSTVTIEPRTELTIDAMKTAADGGTIVLMTQALGRTWNVVTKLITGGSRYEIRTPTTTASVRGTEFEVDAHADATTVSTTEGIVLQRVPAPAGRTVDVPVTAGMTQTQRRDSAPAPAYPRPAASRVVRVSVAATNALVVDAFGRTNGVLRDGRVVAETPGAQVRRTGGAIVVTLPDLSDGRLATRVETDRPDHAALVTTTVSEHGVFASSTTRAVGRGPQVEVAAFAIARGSDGVSDAVPVDPDDAPRTHPLRGAGSHRALEPAAGSRSGSSQQCASRAHAAEQTRPNDQSVPAVMPRDRRRR